jgi:hypothetical protein
MIFCHLVKCVSSAVHNVNGQHLGEKRFEDTVNKNHRLPIKVYHRICTLRHIRIEINHGDQNVF